MNTFTTSMKYFPRGCIFTPRSGAKCPNSAPEVMASKTQKVRLVISFFKRASFGYGVKVNTWD
jgi:hypothetical protein